jgi:hypothetical protein
VSIPDHEVYRESRFVTHLKPKDATCWLDISFPNEEGGRLLAVLEPYLELAKSGGNSYKTEESYLRAIALLLIDRLPDSSRIAHVERATSDEAAPSGEAK